MTATSAGLAAAACLEVAAARRVELIMPGNPRRGYEPWLVSRRC
jgi:hypothetical protein